MVNYRDEVIRTAVNEAGNYLNDDIKKYWLLLGFTSKVEYCACFVTWVFHQHKLTTRWGGSGKVLASPLVVDMMNWFKRKGRYKPPSYNPKPGDLVIYKWRGATTVGHVGIVMSYTENHIKTIEGNTTSPSGIEDSVAIKTRSRNTGEIHGFCAVDLRDSDGPVVEHHEFRPRLNWIQSNKSLTLKEMENNAMIVIDYFRGKGWTKNAVAGLLGNMEKESTINPGRWQSGKVGNLEGGYGLTQWTPASKLFNYLDKEGLSRTDGDAQLGRIHWELNNKAQWITRIGNMSFYDYSRSTLPAGELTKIFTINYERPKNAEMRANERMPYGEKWYKFIVEYEDRYGAAPSRGFSGGMRPGGSSRHPKTNVGISNNHEAGGVYYRFARVPSTEEVASRATLNLSWLTRWLNKGGDDED